MASHEICNPSLHLTIPPKSISIVRAQPLVSLARYAHLLTLTRVWAHTFTNTPPLSFVSKRKHSHPFACTRIRFVIIVVIPQKGPILAGENPQQLEGEPSLKSSPQHSGKELALVTRWAKRCNNHPQEFESRKSCPEGSPSPPHCPTPTLERDENKVTGGRERREKKSHQVLLSPIHCPHSGPSDPWLKRVSTPLPSFAPWSSAE